MKRLTKNDHATLKAVPTDGWFRPADQISELHDPFRCCQRLYRAGKLERRSVVVFGGKEFEYKRSKQS